MEFGLLEMQVIALIGLLGIASLAAWSSAVLWRRQRALEEALSSLALQVAALREPHSLSVQEENEPAEAAPAVAHLIDLLKAADRSTLETVLRPPLDLPRTPAIDIDDTGTTTPRFGFAAGHQRAGWEA